MIKHGIYVENQVDAPQIVNGTSGIQVVIGTAPINMAADSSKVVNTPIVVRSFEEAKAQLGYSDDFEKYTLCQSMYASFKIYGVSPVVFINVLDPTVHKKALEEKEYAVNNKQAVVNEFGVINDNSLQVKKATGETLLSKGTDYLTSYDEDGNLTITLLESGQGSEETSLKISGNVLDPDMVDQDDIIGGVDGSTGKETGLEVIRKVHPATGVIPFTILAPGWSQLPEVGAAMMAKAQLISGIFRALALLDLNTENATKYTEVAQEKEDCGYNLSQAYVLWPMDLVDGKKFYKSAIVGPMMAYMDFQNDDIPSLSPSNKLLQVTGQCLANGQEVLLDLEQANEVNSAGVATAINMNGWRLWGNYTGAYPESQDIKDIWVMVKRMCDWHANTFIVTYMDRVDNPMNNVLVEAVVDAENIRCASYAPDKWAGGSIEYNRSDNPVENILAGQVVFRQKIAPYTPAQAIINMLSYDTELLEATIAGGE